MFRAALRRISLVLACLAICFLFVPAMGAATFMLSVVPGGIDVGGVQLQQPRR